MPIRYNIGNCCRHGGLEMIHEAFEDYLEAVLVLQERLDGVHAADVARFLNVSRPSAGSRSSSARAF